MAKRYWLGVAPAVKQVQTFTITAFDAATTYKITIGGVTVEQIGTTDANTTATNLRAKLIDTANPPPGGGNHPYFTAVTWTVATNVVTGTAVDAGEPFVATESVSGGTGTMSSSVTTANSGPNVLSVAANWDGGTVPSTGDDLIIDRGASICWDLEYLHDNTIDPASFTVMQTFTGTIGLDARVFATNAAATTTNSTAKEYRPHYLKARCAKLDLGQPSGSVAANGSGRIKVNNTKSAASVTTEHGTAANSSDAGLPAHRILAAHASADIYVRSAVAGFGVAVDAPGETSTIGKMAVSASDTTSRALTGDGVTLTSWEQRGGNNVMRAAATVTSVNAYGGVLGIEGDYTITTLTVDGATVTDNHIKTSGNAITTCNLNAGTLDFQGSNVPRTVATMNPNAGTLRANKDFVTFTTLNQPTAAYQMVIT